MYYNGYNGYNGYNMYQGYPQYSQGGNYGFGPAMILVLFILFLWWRQYSDEESVIIHTALATVDDRLASLAGRCHRTRHLYL